MDALKSLVEKKKRILDQINNLKEMRRGSIVEQFFEKKREDGSIVRRGPYLLYTYKDQGQTVSRRLPNERVADQYRAEIEEFRKFEKLSSQFVEISQEICDLKHLAEVSESESSREKKRRKKSSKKSGAKSKR